MLAGLIDLSKIKVRCFFQKMKSYLLNGFYLSFVKKVKSILNYKQKPVIIHFLNVRASNLHPLIHL